MPCYFSPEAEADLFQIALAIAERNPERALSFVEEIRERCINLANYPGIGRSREDLHPGLRSLAHGNYLIFYTALDDGIRIERVIHGARDLQGQFDKE